MANEVKIGTVKVLKGTRYTRSYECAAWFDTIEVQEDVVVPLMATMRSEEPNRVKDWYGPYYRVEGAVVASNKTSYWCGVRIGAPKVDEYLGEVMDHHIATYAHALAKQLLDGNPNLGGGTVTLDPGFQAEEINFVSYRGEPLTTYGIKRVE